MARNTTQAPSPPAQAAAAMTCISIEIITRSWYFQGEAWPVNGSGSRANAATPARSSAGTDSPRRTDIRQIHTENRPNPAVTSRPFPAGTPLM